MLEIISLLPPNMALCLGVKGDRLNNPTLLIINIYFLETPAL